MDLELSITDAHPLLDSPDVYWLDCREQDEWDAVHIEGANLLPMSELSDRLGELDDIKDQHVIVYCHHGGRSLRVANYLRQHGFDQAQSMAGGIDQWAVQIDPSMPRY